MNGLSIWRLELHETDYDQMNGAVVAAVDEAAARKLCGDGAWQDPAKSSCVFLGRLLDTPNPIPLRLGVDPSTSPFMLLDAWG